MERAMVQTRSVKRARRAMRSAAGRKRLSVERQPNGQPRRSAVAERAENMSVALTARVNHGIAQDMEQAKDQRCGSALGRLEMAGRITKNQRLAGEEFAAVVRRDLAAICAAPPHPPAPGPRYKARQRTVEEIRAARDAYDAAAAELRMAGMVAFQAVVTVAVHDQMENKRHRVDMVALQSGLSALMRHFGFANDVVSE